MKNLILILVAALFAFNVSAQTERAGQKPTSVKLEQKEVKKVDNSGGKTEKVVLVIDLLNMDTESKILKILKRIEGILHVELNVREKTATISYDTKIVHVKEIIAALAKEKYDSKIASTNEKVVVLQVVMKVKG
ncbi:MAG: cation transporter, partial [Bacteroidales bacterium]|nr:cation transporter [Bacteroidales bacterium]